MEILESKSYGLSQRTENSARTEGWKTAEESPLQSETSATTGNTQGEETRKRDRIIWITNTTQTHKPFVVQEVNHVSQVVAAIQERIPTLNTYMIGIRMSPQQSGARLRRYLDGYIPYDDIDIYVEFYLRKHMA